MDSSAGHTEPDPDSYVLLERQLLQVPYSTEKLLGKYSLAYAVAGKEKFLCSASVVRCR